MTDSISTQRSHHGGPRHPARRPDLRVGDSERSEVCDLLSRHFADGRLSQPELDERLSAAVAARTETDLRRLCADLPPLPPTGRPRPAEQAPAPAAPGPIRQVLGVLAVIGGLGSIPIILLMLVASQFLGNGVFYFSLVGGTLAAFSGATLNYLVTGPRTSRR